MIWGESNTRQCRAFYCLKNSSIHEHALWASTRENLSSGVYEIKKSAEQPSHPCSLISAFGVRLLEFIISRLASVEISTFSLFPVAQETGLKFTIGNP